MIKNRFTSEKIDGLDVLNLLSFVSEFDIPMDSIELHNLDQNDIFDMWGLKRIQYGLIVLSSRIFSIIPSFFQDCFIETTIVIPAGLFLVLFFYYLVIWGNI